MENNLSSWLVSSARGVTVKEGPVEQHNGPSASDTDEKPSARQLDGGIRCNSKQKQG
jgi:hypothetical protein